jgi:hypothetical protein
LSVEHALSVEPSDTVSDESKSGSEEFGVSGVSKWEERGARPVVL